MAKGIDYLEEDRPIAGQKYFLKSAIKGPDGTIYEKIKFVCGTIEEAKRTAANMIQQDNTFDISVGEIGKWSPVLPSVDNSDDFEYQDQKLNEVMKGYLENQRASKDHFEERKAAVLRDGLLAHLEPEEVIPRGPGPPPPINERQLRQIALQQADAVHPAERAAQGLPERMDTVIDLPLGRSRDWKAQV